MKKTDYENHLDKIKCSPEFRAKMEKLLSEAPDTEYADRVDQVEQAPKWNFSRIGAIAASAVLLVGVGGTAWTLAKQSSGHTSYSESTSREDPNSTEVSSAFDFSEADTDAFDMSAWRTGTDMDAAEQDILGPVPKETAEKIIAIFSDAAADAEKVDETDDWEFLIPANNTVIQFLCDNMCFEVISNGCFIYGNMDEPADILYNETIFDDILDAVGHDLINFNWGTLYDGVHGTYREVGENLDSFLKECAEFITETDETDGLDNCVEIFDHFPYRFLADESSDRLIILYNKADGTENRIAYQTVDGLTGKIISIASERDSIQPSSQPVVDSSAFIDDLFAQEYEDIWYTGYYGTFTAKDFDREQLRELMRGCEWETASASKMNFNDDNIFGFGDYCFNPKGQFLKNSTVYYSPDMTHEKFQAVLESCIAADPVDMMQYRVCNAELNFRNIYADISIDHYPSYGIYNVYSKVKLTYDTVNNKECAMASPLDERDYYAEYYRNGYDCVVLHGGEYAKEMFRDSYGNYDYASETINGMTHITEAGEYAPEYSFDKIQESALLYQGYLNSGEIERCDINDAEDGATTVSFKFEHSSSTYEGEITIDKNGVAIYTYIEETDLYTGKISKIRDTKMENVEYDSNTLKDVDFKPYLGK